MLYNRFLTYLLIAVFAISAVFTACKPDDENDINEIITITTTSSKVYLNFTAYIESITINWGDVPIDELFTSSSFYFRLNHEYLSNSTHTITIKGAVRELWFPNNSQLKALDLSKSTALKGLVCPGSGLRALDLSKCTTLEYLHCQGNQLTTLDLSKCTTLEKLFCSYNQLTTLDLSNCTALTKLYCQNNNFSANALNTLFGTLHSNNFPDDEKQIFIADNPGTEECDVTIAEKKGWIVNKYEK